MPPRAGRSGLVRDAAHFLSEAGAGRDGAGAATRERVSGLRIRTQLSLLNYKKQCQETNGESTYEIRTPGGLGAPRVL